MTLTLAESVNADDDVFVIDGVQPGRPGHLRSVLLRIDFEVVQLASRWPWPRYEVHAPGRERWRVRRGLYSRPISAGNPQSGRYFRPRMFSSLAGLGGPTQDPAGPEGPVSAAVSHEAGTELRRAPRRL